MGESRGDDVSPEVQDRLLEHLIGLQQEYQQLQTWLKQTQLRLSRREAEITHQLRAVTHLLENPQSGPPLVSDGTLDRNSAGNIAVLTIQALGRFEEEFARVAEGKTPLTREILSHIRKGKSKTD